MEEKKLWSKIIEARWGTKMERREVRKVVRSFGRSL